MTDDELLAAAQQWQDEPDDFKAATIKARIVASLKPSSDAQAKAIEQLKADARKELDVTRSQPVPDKRRLFERVADTVWQAPQAVEDAVGVLADIPEATAHYASEVMLPAVGLQPTLQDFEQNIPQASVAGGLGVAARFTAGAPSFFKGLGMSAATALGAMPPGAEGPSAGSQLYDLTVDPVVRGAQLAKAFYEGKPWARRMALEQPDLIAGAVMAPKMGFDIAKGAVGAGRELFRRSILEGAPSAVDLADLRRQARQEIARKYPDPQDVRADTARAAVDAAATPDELQAALNAQPVVQASQPEVRQPAPVPVDRKTPQVGRYVGEPDARNEVSATDALMQSEPATMSVDQLDARDSQFNRMIEGGPEEAQPGIPSNLKAMEKRFVDLSLSIQNEPEGPMREVLIEAQNKLRNELINSPRAADTGAAQGAESPNLPVPAGPVRTAPRAEVGISDEALRRELAARGLEPVPVDEAPSKAPAYAKVEGADLAKNELSLADIFSEPELAPEAPKRGKRLMRDAVPADARDAEILKKRMFEKKLERDLQSGKVQRAGPSRKSWRDLIADEGGYLDVGAIAEAGARGVRSVIDRIKTPSEPEVEPELVSAREPTEKEAVVQRTRLKNEVRDSGRDTSFIDQLDDAGVRRAMLKEYEHTRDLHNAPDILRQREQIQAPQVPKRPVDPIDLYVLDPQSKHNAMRQISLGLDATNAGADAAESEAARWVIGDKRWMDRADHEAVVHVADGSANEADLSRVRERGLQDVVDRIGVVMKMARLHPDIQMVDVVAGRPYLTRSGLPSLRTAKLTAEAQETGLARQGALDLQRTREDLPRMLFKDVDAGKLVGKYVRQTYESRYARQFYDLFVERMTGNKNPKARPKADSLAARDPVTYEALHNLVKQSIGRRETAWSDRMARRLIDRVSEFPAFKATGLTAKDAAEGTGVYKYVGKLPIVGKTVAEAAKYLGESQQPVTDLQRFFAPWAAASGTGFNPASSQRHVAGDAPTMLAKAMQHPYHFAAAMVENAPFLKDPKFAERMYDSGLWDRDMKLSELVKFVGNEGKGWQSLRKARQAGSAAIYVVDAWAKGVTVRMGERVALEKGLSPAAAFRKGVELARTTQNNFTAANTSPTFHDPMWKSFWMFGRAPRRVLNQAIFEPMLDLLHGNVIEAARVPAAVMAVYAMGRAFNYNLLPSILHAKTSKQEDWFDRLAPVAIPIDDIAKTLKIIGGKMGVTEEVDTSDASNLPTSALRRGVRTATEGDPAKNLFGLHESEGDWRDDVDEAIGSTRGGKLFKKMFGKEE